MFNSNSCTICGYSISDPICSNCYIKQTLIILNDLKINSIAIDFIKSKLKSKFILETLNDAECILCKKDIVNLCRYCFSAGLIRILKELNFTQNLIENFEFNPLYDNYEEIKEHEIENIHETISENINRNELISKFETEVK